MATVKTTPVQGGAQYAMVHERVKAFCARYENGQILTEIVKDEQGHVIFKAHAVVDGLIRGTGHAHELEGSSNINNTSHYEACETSAVGRALAMMGYSPDGSLASFEEIENAKLQQSNIISHQKMMETTVAILGNTFREAIDNDDEEQIVECRKDMHGNEPLRQAINKTLSNEQVQYLVDRQTAITEAKNIKSAEKHERNVKFAKAEAQKNSEV
mgnify:FL=1|tara:strand:+ start:619 stop:1260 length:642 start_codon:yes stop_codon:yes gene_type:complete